MRRFRALDGKLADDGKIRLVASTDAPVTWRAMDGDWNEVLVHTPESVDASACRALLINHDPDQIAGPVDTLAFSNGRADCTATIDEAATLESDIPVRRAVSSGALRGVSIGYTYDQRDCTWDDATRTVTVNRWRLLEVTLTPIPADPSAGVRSRTVATAPTPSPEPRTAPMTDAAPTPAPQPDLTAERAAVRAEAKQIAGMCRSVGLNADDFVGMTLAEAQGAMLRAVAERKAAESAPKAPVTPTVTVVDDSGDKLLRACKASLARMAKVTLDKEDPAAKSTNTLGGRGIINAVLRSQGHDPDSMGNFELAMAGSNLLDLRSHGRRDAPNKISAQFSSILANVANKAIVAGMANYNAATWDQWCTQRSVANFLQVTNAGLASGRLSLTPEGEAFPELLQKDGGYNSTLGVYGATISLTYQTLVNDQLGQFMDSLRRIGQIASLTIDRQVYYALMNATWTNDLSTSAGLATDKNLDTPRSALTGKLSPAGEKMGIKARFLLHAPKNAIDAQKATGAIYAPGQTTTPGLLSRSIIPIESHWIDDTALKSGVLYTDYYLTGDPGVVDTVLVNTLDGVGLSPVIVPFDAGAVAAEKWKIMVPFAATVATHTDSASNARVSGMQKATA
jgi:hypothetical protein